MVHIVLVAAPPPILGGDLKISDQNNWAGPEQKIKFEGELNLRGVLKFDGGGAMNPHDVMVVVLKDILLC